MTIPARASAPKKSTRSPRHRLYALIQMGWKELGRDPGELPDFLEQHYGKRSRKKLTWKELHSCVDRLKALGFKPQRSGSRKPLDKAIQRKILALWINGYHLGVIKDPSDQALDKFVRRMTKVDSVRWLTPTLAAKVVEEIKQWLTRAAGVDWTASLSPHLSLMFAQFKILHGDDCIDDDDAGEKFFRYIEDKQVVLKGVGHGDLASVIIIEQGAQIRALKGV